MSNQIYFHRWQRHFSAKMLVGITLCLVFSISLYSTNEATAAPLPTDLRIFTSAKTNPLAFADGLSFDEAGSSPVVGNAAHTGSLVQTIGGFSSTTTINDTTITSGTNPLLGTLSDMNDGWEIHSDVSGSFAGSNAENSADVYDLFFSLQNQSATDSIQVTINLNFDNHVDSSGADAFAASEIILFDSSNSELFFSDIESDTFFGNRFNSGNRTGDFGGPLNDNGLFQHVVTLNPGDLQDFSITHIIEGGAFAAGSNYLASLDAVVSFNAINITNPPAPVPEPGIFALMGIGLLVFLFRRKIKA